MRKKNYDWQVKKLTNMVDLTNYLNGRRDLQGRETPSLSLSVGDGENHEDYLWKQIKKWSPELIHDDGWNDGISAMRRAIADYFELKK